MSDHTLVYTCHAYRWGDRELHSYSVGVYSTKDKALLAASTEEEYRGGKYVCEVLEWVLDFGYEARLEDYVVIKSLPNHKRM